MAYNFWTTFLDSDHSAEGARQGARKAEKSFGQSCKQQ